MVISKTSTYTEKNFRLSDRDLHTEQDRLEIIEALRHGNIYQVFAKSRAFKIGDFMDFFASQWKGFRSQIIQDVEIKSAEGTYFEPDINMFPQHHTGSELDPKDGQLLAQEMAKHLMSGGKGKGTGAKFKAQGTGVDAFTSDLPTGELLPDELDGMAQGTVGDWDQFLEDTWGTIFDQQFYADYQSRTAEIKQEVQRILLMAKQGLISPEFVLIALAKVNQTKNGCLMTWLGKKAFHVNESLNNVSADLHEMSTTGDPNYYAELQVAQNKTREGGMQMNLLMQDMQKVMQDVAGTLEFVKSAMDSMSRTKREIITKFAAR